jgi:uncharacterized protein YegP (UPF0339 family)
MLFVVQDHDPRWLAPVGSERRGAAEFEIVGDDDAGYHWLLTMRGGRIVASAPEPLSSRRGANAAAERLKDSLDEVSFNQQAEGATFRWHAVADNGRRVASSVELFATLRDAERGARRARGLIASSGAPV